MKENQNIKFEEDLKEVMKLILLLMNLSEFFEIIDAGGIIGEGDTGVLFGERQELSSVLLAHARGVGRRKVADMDFPDDGVSRLFGNDMMIVFPARGIGLGKIDDLGACGIHADCLRVYVLCLASAFLGLDDIGIIGVIQVSVNIRGPYAGSRVKQHLLDAEHLSAPLIKRAGRIEL